MSSVRYRRLNNYLRSFFDDYLRAQRGLSINTIKSYRDTWRLLFCYGVEQKKMQKPGSWRIYQVDRLLILDFLMYLEDERHVSARTRNCRLAAINYTYGRLINKKIPAGLHNKDQTIVVYHSI